MRAKSPSFFSNYKELKVFVKFPSLLLRDASSPRRRNQNGNSSAQPLKRGKSKYSNHSPMCSKWNIAFGALFSQTLCAPTADPTIAAVPSGQQPRAKNARRINAYRSAPRWRISARLQLARSTDPAIPDALSAVFSSNKGAERFPKNLAPPSQSKYKAIIKLTTSGIESSSLHCHLITGCKTVSSTTTAY
jgi:hypothetical protein